MVPVTTFTGSLGAGKTTIIMNLVKQLPSDYKVVWLKNEYGDVNVDSELAKSLNIATTEIINGCLCCVLIGKLKDALHDIVDQYNPDRIIIETAGTAYPYPIMKEIDDILSLYNDGIVNVIDILNFEYFRDKGILARKQGKYFDLIILNKHELMDKEKFDEVEDEIYDLYPETPKMKSKEGIVDLDMVFGIDGFSFLGEGQTYSSGKGLHDINIKTVVSDITASQDDNSQNRDDQKLSNEQRATSRSQKVLSPSPHTPHPKPHDHEEPEYQSFSIKTDKIVSIDKIESVLQSLSGEEFYRIKGIIQIEKGKYKILNYVLGRINWQDIDNYTGQTQINFIGRDIMVWEEEVNEKIGIGDRESRNEEWGRVKR